MGRTFAREEFQVDLLATVAKPYHGHDDDDDPIGDPDHVADEEEPEEEDPAEFESDHTVDDFDAAEDHHLSACVSSGSFSHRLPPARPSVSVRRFASRPPACPP